MTKHYDLDTLDDYLHGELDASRDATVHAHLETCAPCRAAYDETAAVRDWVRAAAREDEREFPSLIKARVWEVVRAAKPAPFAFLRGGWRPWVAVPVAALIAFTAYAELPMLHGVAPAGIAASDLLIEHAALMADNPLADRGMVVSAATLDSAQPTSAIIEAADASTAVDPSSDGR